MKLSCFIKNEKVLAFTGGILTATLGVKALKSESARKAAVNTLAKGMQLQDDARATFETMKEDAEDICNEAKEKAASED